MTATKPRMTQDGLTMLYYPLVSRPERVRPEDTLNSLLTTIRQWELSEHSRVQQCKEPEYWEYKYLTDTRRPITWEEFYNSRKQWEGYYLISGNFVELSAVFRFLTKDLKLVEAFQEAFLNNAGREAMQSYQAETEETFDGWRRRFGVLPPTGEGK